MILIKGYSYGIKFEDLVYEAAKDALKETIIKEINKSQK